MTSLGVKELKLQAECGGTPVSPALGGGKIASPGHARHQQEPVSKKRGKKKTLTFQLTPMAS